MIEIVPATIEHVREFYVDAPCTLRAYSALDNGKVVCMAGVYRNGDRDIAFFKGNLNRRDIIRNFDKMKNLFGSRVYAICDPMKESAPAFLRHFGFRPLGDGVYLWTK